MAVVHGLWQTSTHRKVHEANPGSRIMPFRSFTRASVAALIKRRIRAFLSALSFCCCPISYSILWPLVRCLFLTVRTRARIRVGAGRCWRAPPVLLCPVMYPWSVVRGLWVRLDKCGSLESISPPPLFKLSANFQHTTRTQLLRTRTPFLYFAGG